MYLSVLFTLAKAGLNGNHFFAPYDDDDDDSGGGGGGGGGGYDDGGDNNHDDGEQLVEYFFRFSDPKIQTPNHFLLSVMLNSPLPLWTPTVYVRGKNHR